MLQKPMVRLTLNTLMILNALICLIFPLLMADYCPQSGGFSVFAGVGERTREGNDLYREMIESGVIKLGEKQVNALHVFSFGSFFNVTFFGFFVFFAIFLFCLFLSNRVKANALWCMAK